MISYQCLWALFQSGESIYSSRDSPQQLFEVQEVTVSKLLNETMIVCRYTQFDKKSFGWASKTFEIRSFEGRVPLNTLLVYSLAFQRDDTLEKRILTRTKQATEYQGVHCTLYDWIAVDKLASPPTRFPVREQLRNAALN